MAPPQQQTGDQVRHIRACGRERRSDTANLHAQNDVHGWTNAAGGRLPGAAIYKKPTLTGAHLGQGINNHSDRANSVAQNTSRNPQLVIREGEASVELGGDISGGETASDSGSSYVVNGQSEFLYYYHPDHLGSTGFVTDANGELYEHVEYFPFGETWVQEHSNTQRMPYLYTGKELDEETGLYYYGARYYDPRTSVWVSADPILGKYLDGKSGMGGAFNSFNLGLYTYTHLNPVRLIDPDGNAVFKNAQELMAAGLAVLADETVQPGYGGQPTHCNHGVMRLEERGGNTDYSGDSRANDIVTKLSNKDYATPVTEEEAVAYAKQGVTVIAGWFNPEKNKDGSYKSGHVAVVAPVDMKQSTSYGRKVPSIFNVGSKDSMGLKTVAGGFGAAAQPNYYVRNVDLKTLAQRTAKSPVQAGWNDDWKKYSKPYVPAKLSDDFMQSRDPFQKPADWVESTE